MPFIPVVSDVTLTAHAPKIRERVCTLMFSQAELAEGNYVSDRQLLRQFALRLSALCAPITVSFSRSGALPPPTRAVVCHGASFPVWALLSFEVARKPLHAAAVSAESPLRPERPGEPRLFADDTAVFHPRLLEVRIAFPGAETTIQFLPTRVKLERFPARRARSFHQASLHTIVTGQINLS